VNWKRLMPCLLLLAFLASCAIAPSRSPTVTPSAQKTTLPPTSMPSGEIAKVVEVIDGDTIKVEIDGRIYTVRYIGIDTPELHHPQKPVEYFAREAYEKNKELVEGKTVILEKDVSETDRYGRLLRYVYVDGLFVNAYLVEQGYARAVTFPPDVKYADLFRRLEKEAREAGRGLWALSPAPGQLLQIVVNPACSQFDAPGNDNHNKVEEYVCFTNEGESPVDMSRWILRNKKGHTFTFPNFVLSPGASVRVHTGCGTNTRTDLYWCKRGGAVWNNKGDTVSLLDSQGNPIATYSY